MVPPPCFISKRGPQPPSRFCFKKAVPHTWKVLPSFISVQGRTLERLMYMAKTFTPRLNHLGSRVNTLVFYRSIVCPRRSTLMWRETSDVVVLNFLCSEPGVSTCLVRGPSITESGQLIILSACLMWSLSFLDLRGH